MYNEDGYNYGRIGFKGKEAVSFMLLCHEGYENIYFRNGTSPLGQSDWTIPQTIQRTDPLEVPKLPKLGKNQRKMTDFFQRNNGTSSKTNRSELFATGDKNKVKKVSRGDKNKVWQVSQVKRESSYT